VSWTEFDTILQSRARIDSRPTSREQTKWLLIVPLRVPPTSRSKRDHLASRRVIAARPRLLAGDGHSIQPRGAIHQPSNRGVQGAAPQFAQGPLVRLTQMRQYNFLMRTGRSSDQKFIRSYTHCCSLFV